MLWKQIRPKLSAPGFWENSLFYKSLLLSQKQGSLCKNLWFPSRFTMISESHSGSRMRTNNALGRFCWPTEMIVVAPFNIVSQCVLSILQTSNYHFVLTVQSVFRTSNQDSRLSRLESLKVSSHLCYIDDAPRIANRNLKNKLPVIVALHCSSSPGYYWADAM